MTQEMEDWLAANRDEISARIQEGWAAAERGELFTEQQVKEWMRPQKRDWIDERQSHRG